MDKRNDRLLENVDDKMDSFIRGEMTVEEETAFKEEIQADPELRDHVMATMSLIRGIRNQKTEQDKTLLAKHDNSRVRSLLQWACSIAAVIAIFFAYSTDKRYNELSGIVSPYLAEYSMNDVSRGDADSATVAHLYTLFNSIKNQRNVTKIIEELESIYASIDKDFTYNAFANDIAWNLALAYIKNDQIEKAIDVLGKLEADNPKTPIAIKASELKKKL